MDFIRAEFDADLYSGAITREFKYFDPNVKDLLAIGNSEVLYDANGNVREDNNYLGFNYGAGDVLVFNAMSQVGARHFPGTKGTIYGVFTGRYAKGNAGYGHIPLQYWNVRQYEIRLFNPVIGAKWFGKNTGSYIVQFEDKEQDIENGNYTTGRIKAVKNDGTVAGVVWRDFNNLDAIPYFPHTDRDYDDFNFQETGKRQQDWDIYFKDTTLNFITDYKKLFNSKRGIADWQGYNYKPERITAINYANLIVEPNKIAVSIVHSSSTNIVSYGVIYRRINSATETNWAELDVNNGTKIIGSGSDTFTITNLEQDSWYKIILYEEYAPGLFLYQVVTEKTGSTKQKPKFHSPYETAEATATSVTLTTKVFSPDYKVLELGIAYRWPNGVYTTPHVSMVEYYSPKKSISNPDISKSYTFVLDGIPALKPIGMRAYAIIQLPDTTEIVWSHPNSEGYLLHNCIDTDLHPVVDVFYTKDVATKPILIQGAETVTTETTAVLPVSIVSNGSSSPITEVGIYYSQGLSYLSNPWDSPTKKKIKFTGTITDNAYSITLTGLKPGETYAWYPYAVKASGESMMLYAYSFGLPTMPQVIISNIKALNSTSLEVNLEFYSIQRGSLVEVGIVYSNSSQTPTYTGDKVIMGGNIGFYKTILSSLSSLSTYYIRPFVKRILDGSVDIYYGAISTYKMNYVAPVRNLPTIAIPTQSQIGSTEKYQFELKANISLEGTSSITEKGFIVIKSTSLIQETKTIPTPLPVGWTKEIVTLSSDGNDAKIMSKIVTIQPGTYKVCAYAINSAGVAITTSIALVCTEVVLAPSVAITVDAQSIGATNATLIGRVSGDNRTTIIEQGISYKKSTDVEYIDASMAASQLPASLINHTYSIRVETLIPGVNYMYKAYIKEFGKTDRIEGEVKTFTTTALSSVIPSGTLSVTINDLGIDASISLSTTTGILEKGIIYKLATEGNFEDLSINSIKVPIENVTAHITLSPGLYKIATYATTVKETIIFYNTTQELAYKVNDDKEGTFNPPMNPVPIIGQEYTFNKNTWIWTINGWVKKQSYEELLDRVNALTKKFNIMEIEDAEKDNQPVTLGQLKTALKKAKAEATMHTINIEPDQYLTEILNYIYLTGEATAENPYIINFYNHARTILLSSSVGIEWPEYVYLNFPEEIIWNSTNVGYTESGVNWEKDMKTFVGFNFNRTVLGKSGLPSNLNNTFFGYIDSVSQEYIDYADFLASPPSADIITIVWIGGDPLVDERNYKLYLCQYGLKRVFDITPKFKYCNMDSYNFMNSYLYGALFNNASLKGANFVGARMDKVNLENVDLTNANFRNCNMHNIKVNTESIFKGVNLAGASFTSDLDTKAKFIAVVGAGNVDASTIWIDGTSILA